MRHVSAQKHCWWTREKDLFLPPADADEFMMIHPNEWLPYVGKLSNIPLVWLVYAICLHSFIYFYRGLNEKCAKNWPIIGNANARKLFGAPSSAVETCEAYTWGHEKLTKRLGVEWTLNSYFRLFNWLYLPVNSMVQACCTWIPLARKKSVKSDALRKAEKASA